MRKLTWFELPWEATFWVTETDGFNWDLPGLLRQIFWVLSHGLWCDDHVCLHLLARKAPSSAVWQSACKSIWLFPLHACLEHEWHMPYHRMHSQSNCLVLQLSLKGYYRGHDTNGTASWPTGIVASLMENTPETLDNQRKWREVTIITG